MLILKWGWCSERVARERFLDSEAIWVGWWIDCIAFIDNHFTIEIWCVLWNVIDWWWRCFMCAACQSLDWGWVTDVSAYVKVARLNTEINPFRLLFLYHLWQQKTCNYPGSVYCWFASISGRNSYLAVALIYANSATCFRNLIELVKKWEPDGLCSYIKVQKKRCNGINMNMGSESFEMHM